ncbi:hypothetical protein B296_00058995 [Ensete ventricosum]|uniref:Uncharacterized protein n=1 Tax=Ensete ventricosum TaxID=4639 RepID=A0A426X7H7_ENSVE|nr:hypothetical protein B296_00058995 [Ensete ventricosum]
MSSRLTAPVPFGVKDYCGKQTHPRGTISPDVTPSSIKSSSFARLPPWNTRGGWDPHALPVPRQRPTEVGERVREKRRGTVVLGGVGLGLVDEEATAGGGPGRRITWGWVRRGFPGAGRNALRRVPLTELRSATGPHPCPNPSRSCGSVQSFKWGRGGGEVSESTKKLRKQGRGVAYPPLSVLSLP